MADLQESLMQDSLNFFNDVFSLVPEHHRLMPRDTDIEMPRQKSKKQKKQERKQANGALSLLELKERAQNRIAEI